jgi:hypothetical protein
MEGAKDRVEGIGIQCSVLLVSVFSVQSYWYRYLVFSLIGVSIVKVFVIIHHTYLSVWCYKMGSAGLCVCARARVALLIQQATRRHTVTCGPLGLQHIFRHFARFSAKKKVTQHEMCILIFSALLFDKFLILRRIQRDIVINVETSS